MATARPTAVSKPNRRPKIRTRWGRMVSVLVMGHVQFLYGIVTRRIDRREPWARNTELNGTPAQLAQRMPRACTVVLHSGCHGLVPWCFTFFATHHQPESLNATVLHRGYLRSMLQPNLSRRSVSIHGPSPWHSRPRSVCCVAKNVKHHGPSPWHPSVNHHGPSRPSPRRRPLRGPE